MLALHVSGHRHHLLIHYQQLDQHSKAIEHLFDSAQRIILNKKSASNPNISAQSNISTIERNIRGFSVTNVHFAAFHPHTFLIENDSL